MDGVHGSALVSYNAGISACEKHGRWQQALLLLTDMRAARLEPNVIMNAFRPYLRPAPACHIEQMSWTESTGQP